MFLTDPIEYKKTDDKTDNKNVDKPKKKKITITVATISRMNMKKPQ